MRPPEDVSMSDDQPACPAPPPAGLTGAEAAAARAAARRAGADLDGAHDLADAEQPGPSAADHDAHAASGGAQAAPLEPFNMEAERASGWFAWATGGGGGGLPPRQRGRPPRVADAWADALPRAGPTDMLSDDDGDDDEEGTDDEHGGGSSDDDGGGGGGVHAPHLPGGDISAERAALRLRLARLLRPGETAVVALRRLAGTDAVVKPAVSSAPAPATTPTSALARRPPSAQAAFAEVTTLSAALMEAGDFDAPTVLTREAILGTAAAVGASPARPASGAPPPPRPPLAPCDLPPSSLPAPQRPPSLPFPPGLEGTDFRPCPPPSSLPASIVVVGKGSEEPFWYSTTRGVWFHPASGALGDAGTGAWVSGGVSAQEAVGYGRSECKE